MNETMTETAHPPRFQAPFSLVSKVAVIKSDTRPGLSVCAVVRQYPYLLSLSTSRRPDGWHDGLLLASSEPAGGTNDAVAAAALRQQHPGHPGGRRPRWRN